MSDGGTGKPNHVMDFDSSEIGYGTIFGPASGQLPPMNQSVDHTVCDGLYWEFPPDPEGDVHVLLPDPQEHARGLQGRGVAHR